MLRLPRRRGPALPHGFRAIVGLAGILALVAAIALPAVASANGAAGGSVPGNNGTVKIHEGGVDGDRSGGTNDVDNDPHVCTFHIDFFFADAGQVGSWWIETWPPSGGKGTVVLSGSYMTDADGFYRTPPSPGFYSLPDGHYKLFWEGRNDHNIKMKVFWVSCQTQQSPSPSQSESAAPSQGESAAPSESQSARPTESESAAPSESESAAPTERQSAAPTEQESASASMSAAASQSVGGVTSAPSQAVGGITTGGGVTPPPTTTSGSGRGDANTPLRIALFGIAMFLLAMAALTPVLPSHGRR